MNNGPFVLIIYTGSLRLFKSHLDQYFPGRGYTSFFVDPPTDLHIRGSDHLGDLCQRVALFTKGPQEFVGCFVHYFPFCFLP